MLDSYLPGSGDWFDPNEVEPTRLAPYVWSVPMLRPAACRRLLEGLDQVAAAQAEPLEPPNSMHEHAWALEPMGASRLLDVLLRERLAPIAATKFELFHGATLDQRHGYLVNYGRAADQELGFHLDDSEVTLNLCLDQEGSGAELVLMGLRCDLHRQGETQAAEVFSIEHEIGTAIVHAGVHRHRVDPIQRGLRRNLILWARSASVRPDGVVRLPVDHGDWCGA